MIQLFGHSNFCSRRGLEEILAKCIGAEWWWQDTDEEDPPKVPGKGGGFPPSLFGEGLEQNVGRKRVDLGIFGWYEPMFKLDFMLVEVVWSSRCYSDASCLCKESLTCDHSHPFLSRIPNIKLSLSLPCHQIYHTDCNLVLPEGATEAVKSHPASELNKSLPQLVVKDSPHMVLWDLLCSLYLETIFWDGQFPTTTCACILLAAQTLFIFPSQLLALVLLGLLRLGWKS